MRLSVQKRRPVHFNRRVPAINTCFPATTAPIRPSKPNGGITPDICMPRTGAGLVTS